MNRKILFVQPTLYDDSGRVVKKHRLYFVGLAYPLLAAMTPPEWEVEICLEAIEPVPFDTDADVVGIGGMGQAANRGKDIATEFRRRGKTVIMGGPMVTLAPELAAPYCDSIVAGDAEAVWPEVLSDLEAGRLRSLYRGSLTHLSTPLPRYELLLAKRIGDFLPVQAGRGCPHTCNFCSIYCIYRGTYLRRDESEVLRDIRRVRELGLRKFLLLDDNIFADRSYALSLCRQIQPLGMRWMSQCSIDVGRDADLLRALADSGCHLLSFGLESLSRRSLDSLDKSWCDPDEYPTLIRRISEAGIDVATEMIIGADADTAESLDRTVEFITQSPVVAPKFYLMTPIPGTDLFARMKREGRLLTDDLYRISASRVAIRHPNFSPEALNRAFWDIYDRVYSYPNILRRTVLHRRFLRAPSRYLFYLAVNLFYRKQIDARIAPILM